MNGGRILGPTGRDNTAQGNALTTSPQRKQGNFSRAVSLCEEEFPCWRCGLVHQKTIHDPGAIDGACLLTGMTKKFTALSGTHAHDK